MNRPKSKDIDPSILHELLSYDKETGKLYWKVRDKKWFHPRQNYKTQKIWNKRYAGAEAISHYSKGKMCGAIFNKSVYAHRVVWAMHHGYWNRTDIDHINGNPCDNRIENLRLVSHQENCKNQKLRSTNKTGKMGVDFRKETQKYRARIMVDGKTLNLGEFKEFDKAVKEREEAEIKYGFHKNHGRKDNNSVELG